MLCRCLSRRLLAGAPRGRTSCASFSPRSLCTQAASSESPLLVVHRQAEHIASVQLSHKPVNALTHDVCVALNQAIRELDDDPEVHGMLLGSAVRRYRAPQAPPTRRIFSRPHTLLLGECNQLFVLCMVLNQKRRRSHPCLQVSGIFSAGLDIRTLYGASEEVLATYWTAVQEWGMHCRMAAALVRCAALPVPCQRPPSFGYASVRSLMPRLPATR